MLAKTQIPGYLKDPKTGLVVHADDAGLAMYHAERRRQIDADAQSAYVNSLEAKIDAVLAEVAEVKAMLKKKR
jgi:hypothetical protein